MSSDLTIELPYDIEKENSSEEFESWYLHEPDDSEREYDTEHSSTSYSPEYCLLAISSSELLGRHPNEDSIISTHDEVDEDDIEKSKCSCAREYVSKISRKSIKHRE